MRKERKILDEYSTSVARNLPKTSKKYKNHIGRMLGIAFGDFRALSFSRVKNSEYCFNCQCVNCNVNREISGTLLRNKTLRCCACNPKTIAPRISRKIKYFLKEFVDKCDHDYIEKIKTFDKEKLANMYISLCEHICNSLYEKKEKKDTYETIDNTCKQANLFSKSRDTVCTSSRFLDRLRELDDPSLYVIFRNFCIKYNKDENRIYIDVPDRYKEFESYIDSKVYIWLPIIQDAYSKSCSVRFQF